MMRGSICIWFAIACSSLSLSCAPHRPIGSSGSGGAGVGSTATSTGTSFTTGNTSTTGSTGTGSDSHCSATNPDLEGCTCANAGDMRACYPANANPKTRSVGACKDGHQTCAKDGEFSKWGSCTGATTPVPETCTDHIDNNCDGLLDCNDPTCASNAACNGACMNGATRPCYTGPPGTENTGICKPGTQTCVNGQWSSGCSGQVLPQPEVCSDLLDHNCNGLPGCFDFFNCLTDPACMPPPCMPANGCTCPTGSGDAAVCPNGDYGDPQSGLCCPCTANTCGQLGCCGESICAGSSVCGMLTCGPLAASCNGMVNVDCDFEDLATSNSSSPPEDCDQACCKCKPVDCP